MPTLRAGGAPPHSPHKELPFINDSERRDIIGK